MNLYFKLAYRNIKSHWRKSLAAILSISLGFMTMAIFEGYINQSRRLLVAGFTHRFMNGHIIIEKEGLWSTQGRRSPWQFYLTEQDQAEIGKILDSSSEVNVWMKGLRINGLLTNGRTSRIFTGIGYDLDKGKKLRTDVWYRSILYGDPLEDHPTKSVLVGQLLGRSIGCVPNPKVKIVRKGLVTERQLYNLGTESYQPRTDYLNFKPPKDVI